MAEQVTTESFENVALMSEEDEEYKGINTTSNMGNITRLESDYKIDSLSFGSTDNAACLVAWKFVDLWGKTVDLDITVIALDDYSIEMAISPSTFMNKQDTNINSNDDIQRKHTLNGTIRHSESKRVLDLASNPDADEQDEQPPEYQAEKQNQVQKEIEIDLKALPSKCFSLWFMVHGKIVDVESAEFRLLDSHRRELHNYSILMSGYNPTAMLLGVLWRDENGKDWNYNKIEERGDGNNYTESKQLLLHALSFVYPQHVLRNRPRDRYTNCSLGSRESYVIDPEIERVTLGLGWDPAEYGTIDIDGALIIFANDMSLTQIVGGKYSLFYGDAVRHHGDSGDGKGAGDDEKIDIWMEKMNTSHFGMLCVVININSGATSFKAVKNCFARLCDEDGRELCRFRLSGVYNTRGMIMCTLQKQQNGCWVLNTVGLGVGGWNAKQSMQACKKVCMGQHLTDKDRQTDDCCCVVL